MMQSATFSPCRTWRYSLSRQWGERQLRTLVVIGLNPSTADETTDDPTIRRCIGFAKTWGFDRLTMLNLFAFRATDPRAMKAASDPTGPENDGHLLMSSANAARVVAAWGTHGAYRDREREVREMLHHNEVPIYHLGLTKDGHPRHPLYLRADTLCEFWEPNGVLV